MAVFSGFPPPTAEVSIETSALLDLSPTYEGGEEGAQNRLSNPWRNDEARRPDATSTEDSGVRWWDINDPLMNRERGCDGAHIQNLGCGNEDFPGCEEPMCVDEPRPPSGPWLPFNVYKRSGKCSPVDGIDRVAEARQDLTRLRSAQLAYAAVMGASGNPSLSSLAVDLTPPTGPVSPQSAVTTLVRSRRPAQPGYLWTPDEALGALRSDNLLDLNGSRYSTIKRTPVISDSGLPNIGPGGAPAPPGAAWTYVSGLGGWAVHPLVTPTDQLTEGGKIPDAFYDVEAGCYVPTAKQLAIVTFTTCLIFAILMDVRDCNPCGSFPASGGGAVVVKPKTTSKAKTTPAKKKAAAKTPAKKKAAAKTPAKKKAAAKKGASK